MPDASYDAVIIGAGHNGLTLAAYLARSGLSVGVLERRHEDGGGANTEEATVPGFYHNLHAQFMEFIDYMPIYEDFELEKLGAQMIKPDAQLGVTFADGRPPIIIHLPQHMDKTYKSIAQYSRHDAETWRDLKMKIVENDQLIASFIYTPMPDREGENGGGPASPREAGLIWSLLGLPATYTHKSPKVIIDELFESDELRTLLYRQCIEWGANLHSGVGMGFVFSVLWLCGIHYLSVGGTHTLFHAMAQAALRGGASLRFSSPVERVLLRNGRAVGVRLQDGKEVEARKLVASNADPRQTWVDLIGVEHINQFRKERLAHWHFGPEGVLGTPSFALHEAPDYKSARWDPTINKTFYTVVGFETSEQMSNYILQAYGGTIPERPGAGTWVNSLWDPTQAPPGKHVMNGWFFFPNASCLTPEEWDEVRATYNDRFLELWEQYAPNMTPKNVIAHKLYGPYDIERKMAMPEGDFFHGHPGGLNTLGGRSYQHRTEIEGFYLCGASSGAGGITAAPGYNAFKIICEDLNLPKIWQKEGRLY
jgi:phytoene dehydrogenase-like protein